MEGDPRGGYRELGRERAIMGGNPKGGYWEGGNQGGGSWEWREPSKWGDAARRVMQLGGESSEGGIQQGREPGMRISAREESWERGIQQGEISTARNKQRKSLAREVIRQGG